MEWRSGYIVNGRVSDLWLEAHRFDPLQQDFFFFRVTSCADSFLYPFHSFLAAVASKIPQSFCQNCRLWVAATPGEVRGVWLCCSGSVGTHQGNKLAHIREHSPSHLSLLCCCGLLLGLLKEWHWYAQADLHFKKNPPKKCRWEIICGTLPIFAWEEKATTTSTWTDTYDLVWLTYRCK